MANRISKSALSAMLVAGGLVAALPAATTPANAKCGATKSSCNPCAGKKAAACNPCAGKKK